MKIPGVNAPIPPGASYGYHPGGWGKAPVSEYRDVFGVQQQYNQEEELIGNTKHWGDLEEKEEEEEEEELEAEQIEEEELTGGEESEANIQSVGVETLDVIDLRKRPRTEPDKYLYRVLEKKEERIAPGTLLGTPHVYVIGGSGTRDKTAAKGVDYLLRRQKSDGVDVTLQPEELEVMDDALQENPHTHSYCACLCSSCIFPQISRIIFQNQQLRKSLSSISILVCNYIHAHTKPSYFC